MTNNLSARMMELTKEQASARAFGEKAEIGGKMNAVSTALTVSSNGPQAIIDRLETLLIATRANLAAETSVEFKAHYLGTISEIDRIIAELGPVDQVEESKSVWNLKMEWTVTGTKQEAIDAFYEMLQDATECIDEMEEVLTPDQFAVVDDVIRRGVEEHNIDISEAVSGQFQNLVQSAIYYASRIEIPKGEVLGRIIEEVFETIQMERDMAHIGHYCHGCGKFEEHGDDNGGDYATYKSQCTCPERSIQCDGECKEIKARDKFDIISGVLCVCKNCNGGEILP